MPFINDGPTKKQWFYVAVGAVLFAFGQHVGALRERARHQAAVPAEVQELIRTATFNTETISPNDTMLWAALLPEAKLCDNCNALREYRSVPGHTIRPLVLSVNGDSDSTRLTMVFGTLTYSQGHRSLTPKIVYYIGHRSGSLARIDETGKVEYRVGSDEWRPAEDGSVLREEARQTFQKQWRMQLTSAKY